MPWCCARVHHGRRVLEFIVPAGLARRCFGLGGLRRRRRLPSLASLASLTELPGWRCAGEGTLLVDDGRQVAGAESE